MKFKDFLKEKGISDEQFEKMTATEIAQLHNEFSEKKHAELMEQIEKATTEDEVKGLIEENQKETNKTLKELKDLLKKQGETITEIKARGNANGQPLTFEKAVENALKERYEDLKEFVNSKARGGEFEIEIKLPAPITTGNTTVTGTTPANYGATQVTSISEVPTHQPFIEDFLTVGNTDQPSIPYVDEIPGEGDAGIVAEGSLKPLIDAKYKTEFSQAKKIAGRMKVSDEALSDFKWLLGAITGRLKRKHDIARQNAILNGDASAGMNGIVSLAPAFNPAILGALANTMTNPNHYDVLATVISVIEAQSEGNFVPNLVLMNTMDALAMKLTKDNQGRYLLPPFITKDGKQIEGVQVVTKPFINQGEFVVGDFKLVNLYNVWTFKVLIGMENDDFGKNMRTLIGESRLHLYLTQNDRRAFVKGTFANVITALKKTATP